MKVKLSITVEKSIVKEIQDSIDEGRFRNKSHALEYAVRRFLREGN